MPLEPVPNGGEVDAEVGTAALFPVERALCNESRQEVRARAQPLEPGGVSNETAVAPKCAPEPRSRTVRGVGIVRRGQARRKARLVECGKRGAAPEDQALEQ